MDQYCVKWAFAGLFNTGEYHTDYPEEDNIVSGYQYISWVEVIQIFCLIWPAKSGEWP